MRKIAWPPGIGTPEHEAGSMSPTGDPVRDIKEHSHQRYDMQVNQKSVAPDEDQSPSKETTDGMIGGMGEIDGNSYNKADAPEDKENIEVSGEEGLVASFACNVAESFQDKVAGLQVYPELKESAGLIFKYRRPEDVVYHMGTVKYPIDIIFVDKDQSIKKIYKNIRPGTLATFGCAGVKSVLEICGGLSDRLGIFVGNKVKASKVSAATRKLNKLSSDFGIKKDFIVKHSDLESVGVSNWMGYPFLTVNSNSMVKEASKRGGIVSNLISAFPPREKEVVVFDLDNIIEKSPNIKIYKTKKSSDENEPLFMSITGSVVPVRNGDYREVHFNNLTANSLADDESILLSMGTSFSDFMRVGKDDRKIFEKIIRTSMDKNSVVVIASRFNNINAFKNLLSSRIDLEFGNMGSIRNAEIISIPEDSDASDIIDLTRERYGTNITLVSDSRLLKRSGNPVSDDIKVQAKRAYKLLDEAAGLVNQSLDNIKQNASEYDKIRENASAISASKGQYNQSIKNNTKVVKGYLLKIRDAIKILNKIRDISTTMGVIESMTNSAKTASDSIEGVFDLIERLDSADFAILIEEETSRYEKAIGDLNITINRAKEYINQHILGIMVLSD
jgi:uncharacterized protein